MKNLLKLKALSFYRDTFSSCNLRTFPLPPETHTKLVIRVSNLLFFLRKELLIFQLQKHHC